MFDKVKSAVSGNNKQTAQAVTEALIGLSKYNVLHESLGIDYTTKILAEETAYRYNEMLEDEMLEEEIDPSTVSSFNDAITKLNEIAGQIQI